MLLFILLDADYNNYSIWNVLERFYAKNSQI